MSNTLVSISYSREKAPAFKGFDRILADLQGESLHLTLRAQDGVEIERIGVNHGHCLEALTGETYLYSLYEVIDFH